MMLTRPVSDNRAQRALGGQDVPSTVWQGIEAAFGADTMGSLLARQGEINAAENRGQGARRREARTGRDMGDTTPDVQRVAPEILNERYRDYGVTFDAPMTEDAARIIAEARRAQNIRNDVLARAPGGFSNASYFAAGLAGIATDPTEVAASLIPFVGPTRLAALTARFGTIGGRVAAGAVEGVLGNALVEPIVYGLSRQQRLDYEMADALLNIGLGGALGGALGGVSGALARRRERGMAPAEEVQAPRVEQPLEPAVDLAPSRVDVPDAPTAREAMQALRAAVSQMANGTNVNVSRIISGRGTVEQVTNARSFPVLGMLRSRGGIDPESEVAGELRSMGVTERTLPGLFRRGGKRDIDNIPATDELWVEEGLIQAARDADGGFTYMDRQSILDAVRSELEGNPIRTTRNAEREDVVRKFRDQSYALDNVLEEYGVTLSEPEYNAALARVIRGEDPYDVFEDITMRGPDPDDVAPQQVSEEFEPIPFFDEELASRDVSAFLDAAGETEADEAMLLDMVTELRRTGDLDAEAEAALLEADAIVARSEAVGDVARAYAACLAR